MQIGSRISNRYPCQTRAFCCLRKKLKSFDPLHLPSFLQLPHDWINAHPLLPLRLPSMHKRIHSLALNSTQDRTRDGHNTNDDIPHDFLHPPIDTRGLCSREVEEPQCAEGRRCAAHHSKKCAIPLRRGDHAGGCSGGGEKEGAVGGIPNGRSLPPWRACTGR